MEISIVIPSRKRLHHLRALLGCIAAQTFAAAEVIVVDSSDDKSYGDQLKQEFPELKIIWIDSIPSVCIQRNLAIQEAKGSWVFLCDDDIEIPKDYLEKLVNYIDAHPSCGVVSGALYQVHNGRWVESYPPKNFADLLWRYIFQLSVWGDISKIKTPLLLKPLGPIVKNFYCKRGNSISLAGWPLITQWKEDHFQTTFYSLGANLVKREWLLNSPYDEVLDPGGIGDNYGVTLGFPGTNIIHVVRTVHAYHHMSNENRLAEAIAYYRRILALHYFLKRGEKRSAIPWLIWSLAGSLIIHLFKADMQKCRACLKATAKIASGKNPYWKGHLANKKVVEPQL
jgi:glycosyltransferase involved in cell wall biosynthesis